VIAELEQDAAWETGRRARTAVLTALSELGGESRRQPLLAKAGAEGGFSERELAAPAPADTRGRYDNDVAFRLSRALHQLKRDGLVETPTWNVWRLTCWTPAEPACANEIPADRRAALSAMPYHEYLRTPEWHQLRAAALARAELRCALNRHHTDHLEVHHTTLERLGAERSSDLVVLCRGCHQTHYHLAGPHSRLTSLAELEAHRAAASIPPPVGLAPPAAPEPEAGMQAPAQQRSRLRRLLGGV
jgi:hypothetical protein